MLVNGKQIIPCPKCDEQFLLLPEKLGKNGHKLQCSMCSHIWHENAPKKHKQKWRPNFLITLVNSIILTILMLVGLYNYEQHLLRDIKVAFTHKGDSIEVIVDSKEPLALIDEENNNLILLDQGVNECSIDSKMLIIPRFLTPYPYINN